MPGEGHMVHMPAHIYVRVGRYADAAASNVHAIHTDETFIEGQQQPTVYSLAYYPHNIHFLAFVSRMAGRSAQAIETARMLKSKINMDVAPGVGMLQEMVPYYVLTLTTFGRWNDVLAEPLPPPVCAFPPRWHITPEASRTPRRVISRMQACTRFGSGNQGAAAAEDGSSRRCGSRGTRSWARSRHGREI